MQPKQRPRVVVAVAVQQPQVAAVVVLERLAREGQGVLMVLQALLAGHRGCLVPLLQVSM